ncbi:hypothetical protein Spock_38 [Bacillus phage Spock]|uniref:Uncharacterized protein n=1 Tax=Bacillus phage Spock TaxID=1406791 RepID=U5Q0L7_9CAUD|nr:hypothetical protein Spock_38 [Bacillus phage Spock]AGY48438.1 hypothetical protein Spock_38 [Bacillus phage Spock]
MTKITFELTDKQVELLKEFNSKHYDGAEDNRYTCDAIHVVQRERKGFIPFVDELLDYYDGEDMRYTWDDDYEVWYEKPEELVEDYYDGNGEDCPIEIKPYEEVEHSLITDVYGEEVYIHDEEAYIKAHGISNVHIAFETKEWEDVAFFFILDKAKAYRQYQAHNLGKSRIFTYSMGYDNRGDLPVFRDMLLAMGKQLNGEEGK